MFSSSGSTPGKLPPITTYSLASLNVQMERRVNDRAANASTFEYAMMMKIDTNINSLIAKGDARLQIV